MKSGIIFEIKQKKAVVMTTDGEFLSIPARAGWNIGDNVPISEFEWKANAIKQKKKKNPSTDLKKYYKKAMITIVASLLFFMIPFSITTEASTFVTLDINPSFELEIKNEEVVNVKALNSDGDKVIQNMDSTHFQGSLYQVTSNILDKVQELGYISEVEEPIVMVGVMSKDKQFETEKYEQFIGEKLKEKSLNSDVLLLNATKKSDKKIADKKGVSLGKYLLQDKEKEEGIIITDEQLKKESVKEIMKDIKEKKEKKENDKKNDKTTQESSNNKEKNSEVKNSNKINSNGTSSNNKNANNSKKTDDQQSKNNNKKEENNNKK